MGYGIEDNIIIVDILDDGSVKYELIALDGADIHALGKLEDYKLPTEPPPFFGGKFPGD